MKKKLFMTLTLAFAMSASLFAQNLLSSKKEEQVLTKL